MTKEGCIINPQTGRAVKTTTKLGKKLMAQAQQLDDEYKGGKVLKAAAKRAAVQKEAAAKNKAGGVLAAAAKRAIAKKPEPPKSAAKPKAAKPAAKPKAAPKPKEEAGAPEPKAEPTNPSYTPEELNALQKEKIIELIFRTYKLREGRVLDREAQGARLDRASKRQMIYSAVEIYVMRDPAIDAILKKKKNIAPLNDKQIQQQYQKSIQKYAGKNEAAEKKPADIIFNQRVIERSPPPSSSSSSSSSPPARRLPPYPINNVQDGVQAAMAYIGRLQ